LTTIFTSWRKLVQNNETIRILIADEQALFREAVRMALDNEQDIEVVGEARDGLQAADQADRLHPDVALLEANLPNCNGVRATKLIKERAPDCNVIIITGTEDQQSLTAALEAGARGYMTKEAPVSELIEAARVVRRGQTLIPPGMLGGLLERLLTRRRSENEALRQVSKLTRREKEVLAMLSQGSDNDVIARDLVISPQTARTHVQNVLTKLGLHSRLQAAAFVVQNRVLDQLVGSWH
jgi:DNA-binding NarL/FixJ family response regulator